MIDGIKNDIITYRYHKGVESKIFNTDNSSLCYNLKGFQISQYRHKPFMKDL